MATVPFIHLNVFGQEMTPQEKKGYLAMLLWSIRGRPLITREIALDVARMVLKSAYGEADLVLQEPLQIEDAGQTWIIKGKRKYLAEGGWDNTGPAFVEIRKDNCQILDLSEGVRPAPTSKPDHSDKDIE